MNHRLSRYFDIQELVCPHVYDKFGLYAWQFFDPRLLDVMLVVREKTGLPIVVNNWAAGGQLTQRGLRCNLCPIVKEKTSLEKLYMSPHPMGMALDFNIVGQTVEETHKWIVDNRILLPHPIRLEEPDGINRVHLDTRSDGFRAITWFKG